MLIPYIFDYFWVCFTYLALAPLPRGSRAGFAAKETDVWTDPAVKNRGYDSQRGSCQRKIPPPVRTPHTPLFTALLDCSIFANSLHLL